MKFIKRFLPPVVLIIFGLNGCTALDAPLSATGMASTTPIVILDTQRPPVTPLPTETLEPTGTPSPTETVQPTATHTATEPPTLPPLPTLPADEAQALVLELLQTNAGCQLPCYWGFVPGKTLWREAEQFLATFVDEFQMWSSNDLLRVDIPFSVPEEIAASTYLRQAYFVKDGVIELIYVDAGNIPSYTLSNFLNTYGPPEEIWLAPGREDIYSFIYRLYYPQQGILAAFYHVLVTVTQDYALVCPRNESNPSLALWDPNTKESFLEVHTEIVGHVESEPFLFQKIEEVTNMSVETFYDTYRDLNTTTCFEIPRDKWPDLPPGPSTP